MNWLRDISPSYWLLMREAAIWRHAVLVYGTLGFTPSADAVMAQHMLVVRAVYDSRKQA